MTDNEQDDSDLLELCVEFLNNIGIETTYRRISNKSFLPGLLINNGAIIIDKDIFGTPRRYFA